MHIWYVSHYAGGPGIGVHDRAYDLARAWLELGHSVTVFVAAFHHLLERETPLAPEIVVDGVRYVAVPARRYAENGTGRLLNILDFTRNLYGVGRWAGEHAAAPDAVIASSPHPFAILPAHRLARRHGARLVFEIRDIWPLTITEVLGVSRLNPFVQMCAAVERYALTRSDLVASVLPRADRYLLERGWGGKPFVWVPNGLGPEKQQDIASEGAREAAAKLAQWRTEGRTTIVHAGSLGWPNAVDLLLEAVACGASRGEAAECRVLLVGSGAQMEALRTLTRELSLTGVHFSGRVPKGEVAKLLAMADIAYAGVRPLDRLYRYGVSLNKFADYYAAGLPVVLPIAPCGDPVSESGGGIARAAATPEALWSLLHELVRMAPDERRALGAKGKAHMAREYDWGRIARRYAEAMEHTTVSRLTSGRGHPGRRPVLSR